MREGRRDAGGRGSFGARGSGLLAHPKDLPVLPRRLRRRLLRCYRLRYQLLHRRLRRRVRAPLSPHYGAAQARVVRSPADVAAGTAASGAADAEAAALGFAGEE